MRTILTITFLLGTVINVHAQYQFIKQWDKVYGGNKDDAVKGLFYNSDGSLTIGGHSDSPMGGDKTEESRGSYDYWIVKIDSNGNKIWDRRFGGNRSDIAYTVLATNDGGFLLGGISNSDAGFEKTEGLRGSAFYDDGWVVKIDSAGNKEWDKSLGGLEYDAVFGLGQTQDSGYLVLVYTQSYNAGGDIVDSTYGETDAWVVKLTYNGQIEWQKRFGGSTMDNLFKVIPLQNNQMLLLGSSNSPADGNRSISKKGNWFIVIDSLGNSLQQFAYHTGAGFGTFTTTSDNGYLWAGSADRPNSPIEVYEDRTDECLGPYNTIVIKLDSNFNKLWDKIIYTTGNDREGFAVQTSDGCYIAVTDSRAGIGGYKTQAAWDSSYDYFVVKFCMERVNGIDPLSTPKEDLIQVYPNPFTEEVSIALQNSEIHEATFTLADINGKILYNKEEDHLAPGYTKVLDLRQLPTGVYFITVQTAQGQVVKRVVKE